MQLENIWNEYKNKIIDRLTYMQIIGLIDTLGQLHLVSTRFNSRHKLFIKKQIRKLIFPLIIYLGILSET